MRFGEERDGLREACGVFGAYDLNGENVASDIYYGLFALQHRGQESAGIAVTDTSSPEKKVLSHKGMGLVNDVFSEKTLQTLKGNLGVGHVRYSTAGSSTIENAQPLVLNYVKGTLCMAHNGNLVNAPELKEELQYTGAIFQTTIDSELIAYEIARARIRTSSVEKAVVEAMRSLKGAYSLVLASPRKLMGARDPQGFKPLCIGRRDNMWVITSESCALETIGADFVRDIRPGEVVTIHGDGRIESDTTMCPDKEKEARCVFEYIYFARPDTNIDGVSIYDARVLAGKILARTSPVDADIVVGVPESGTPAALGYSIESGLPYRTAFVKNTYVGRTFIKPGQKSREAGVDVKLNVLRTVVKDKRVVIIDDSIVRGTTSARIVNMLRKAGAKEVHLRVSAPPFLYPCYFGTDIPSSDQLIAYGRTVPEIAEEIGVDSLGYLPIEDLPALSGHKGICNACFTGQYPVDPPTADIRGEYEH